MRPEIENLPAGPRRPARIARDRAVVRKEREIQRLAPWIQIIDRPMLHAFAQLDRLANELFQDIRLDGVKRRDGSPNKLIASFAKLRATQAMVSARLGLDPASRAAMEGSDAKMTIDLDEINKRIGRVLRQRNSGYRREAGNGTTQGEN